MTGVQTCALPISLTSYLDTLLQSGFTLRRLVEPKPPEELMDLPGMRDELRRPMMLLIAAEKRQPQGG